MLAKSPEVWAYTEHLHQPYSDQMERAKLGPLLLHLQLRCYQKGHGNLSLSVLLERKTKSWLWHEWLNWGLVQNMGQRVLLLFIYWRSVCITCSLMIIIWCNSWELLINCYPNLIRVSSFLMRGQPDYQEKNLLEGSIGICGFGLFLDSFFRGFWPKKFGFFSFSICCCLLFSSFLTLFWFLVLGKDTSSLWIWNPEQFLVFPIW